VKVVHDYLRHAEECEALAAKARPEQREMIAHMAKTWRLLAEQRVLKLNKQNAR